LIQHGLEVFVACGQRVTQPPPVLALESAARTAASWTPSEQLRETRLTTSAIRQLQFEGELGSPHCALPTVLYHMPLPKRWSVLTPYHSKSGVALL
jgi:hypothetical protein